MTSLIIYSGFERIAPEGDSHIDIEFFQNPVALDEAVPCNDPGTDVDSVRVHRGARRSVT